MNVIFVQVVRPRPGGVIDLRELANEIARMVGSCVPAVPLRLFFSLVAYSIVLPFFAQARESIVTAQFQHQSVMIVHSVYQLEDGLMFMVRGHCNL